jgi:short-subunit dehydrogenase
MKTYSTAIILVARSEVKLHLLATEIAERHRIHTEVIVADLSAVGAARRVWEEVGARGLVVDLLINNAGFGSYGTFDTLALPLETEQISLNITALV